MMDDHLRRRNMVEAQIRTNKVTDRRVIDALMATPRERFVPPGLRGVAYVDEDLAIAPARYLVEPMVFARLLQTAELQPADRVLDLACGAGYSAAVLARVVAAVVAVESDAALAGAARQNLSELGLTNVRLIEGPLTLGAPEEAPFDAIVINGAVAGILPALIQQLREGGRLVAVVKQGRGPGRATRFDKRDGGMSARIVFDAATPMLPGFAAPEGFVF